MTYIFPFFFGKQKQSLVDIFAQIRFPRAVMKQYPWVVQRLLHLHR